MKIFIKTYGCTANKADADSVRSLLLDKYELVESLEESDLVICLSCGVKGPTENKIIEYLKNVKEDYPRKKVIIAGCLPMIIGKRLRELFPTYSKIGVDQIQEIENICEWVFKGEVIDEVSFKGKKIIKLKEVKEEQPILIAEGCLGGCAYCAAKFARGKLKSFPQKEIVELVKSCVERGTKKILLTAQDTGCYGKDIGTNLVELLKDIIKIYGDFKIRVGMMNPEHLKKMMDEMILVYKNPKIIKFLHLPVQSGSNEVLKAMGRKYTVEEFEEIVDKFRKEIPSLIISTDIIVGFPTETEEQFQETVSLIKRIRPEVLNISKFYARPGTKAKGMKQLASEEIKRRSVEISRVFEELRKN